MKVWGVWLKSWEYNILLGLFFTYEQAITKALEYLNDVKDRNNEFLPELTKEMKQSFPEWYREEDYIYSYKRIDDYKWQMFMGKDDIDFVELEQLEVQ